MKQRILTGLVGIPVVLLALFGDPIFAEIFIAIVGIVGILEYLRLVEHSGIPTIALFLSLLFILIVMAILLTAMQFALLLLVLLLIAAILHGVFGQPRWLTFGVLYVTVPLAMLVSLRLSGDDGTRWLLLLLATTWTTDTMALFGGMTFGKHLFAPRISPKKTWEGTITGVISGFLMALLIGWLQGLTEDHLLTVIMAALILPSLGVMGDLLESKIKRVYGKKDSGHLLPGHGGILDRVDSLFFTTIGLFALVVLLP